MVTTEDALNTLLTQEFRDMLLSTTSKRFPGMDETLVEDGVQVGWAKAVNYVHDNDMSFPSKDDLVKWALRLCTNAVTDEYRRDAAWRRIPTRTRRTMRSHGLDDETIEPIAGVVVFSDLSNDTTDFGQIVSEIAQSFDWAIGDDDEEDHKPDPRLHCLAAMDRDCLKVALAYVVYTGKTHGWQRFVERFLRKGRGYARRQAKKAVNAAKKI